MRSKRSSLSITLPVLVLLSGQGCVQAFSFCFASGGGDSHRARYNDYLPPLPGNMPGLYGGYTYSPAPAYPGDGGYYSLPYDVPAAEPVPIAPESRTYYE
jgi:hypothetical protein